jgi:diacylglycerol kinase (ATP)
LSSFLKSRIKSIGHALRGIRAFFIEEKNGQIQLVAAIIVTCAGFIFNISTMEWCIQTLCIAIVLGFEMLNSAIEKSVDLYQSSFNEKIRFIKDVSAGAVLLSAIISVIIAAIIYLPKIVNFAN